MLNDVTAAGLTPEGLAEVVSKAGDKFVRDAGATVIVREIRSRKVYIIGEVAEPGTFQLGSEMTVLQAIGEAGGFIEGADKGDVIIVRNEGGKERRFKFNYNDVVEGQEPGAEHPAGSRRHDHRSLTAPHFADCHNANRSTRDHRACLACGGRARRRLRRRLASPASGRSFRRDASDVGGAEES